MTDIMNNEPLLDDIRKTHKLVKALHDSKQLIPKDAEALEECTKLVRDMLSRLADVAYVFAIKKKR